MVAVLSDISIHALRKESDEQSTDNAARGHISIHALRKESDPPNDTVSKSTSNFNPRSP